MSKSILSMSAVELARAIREGTTCSRDVVEAHIARIEEVNPTLNAMVHNRFEEARVEADSADRQVREVGSETLPPLHGVPFTIKESFAVRGMPNTSGLMARRGHVAEQDATAVMRLREAGGIALGVSNTSELCMWMETNNRVYGRTNNAYRADRTAGGSSGGEGAIVGGGGSPFGLGADVGGSIRMPAFFNGVFGHKSTGGLVPGTGQFPISVGDALRYLCSGPICRRAEDLMPLMRILSGPDGEDEGCVDIPLGDPATVDLSSLKVLDVRSINARLVASVDDDLLDAQSRVADFLADQGASVIPAQFDGLANGFDIWSSMLGAAEGRSAFRRSLGGMGRRQLLGSLALRVAGRSSHTLPALVLGLVENTTHWSSKRLDRLVREGQELREEIIDRMGPNGVMLLPSHPWVAPPHKKPLTAPFNWVYTAIINVLMLPSTQVPLGLNAEGLPVGIQVVGAPGMDHRTIGIAMALEEAFGGWVPPWTT